MSEMMKLLGSAKDRVTSDENGENVHHSENTEVLLLHCNTVNNDYQHNSKVLYAFISNDPFGQLLERWLLIKILTARDRR